VDSAAASALFLTSFRSNFMKLSPLVLGGCALLFAAGAAHAQRTKSTDGEPCCGIVAIDLSKNVVTARDKAGKTFRFTVHDAGLFKTLRVGQAVAADFMTGKVTIHGAEPCCAILKNEVKPAEPCCAITAVDSATGIATAKELATGRVFRFEVKDKALLRSLTAGQKIFADFGSSKVRVHGLEPCCNIIGHGIN
jgi:Cu/Ag efflux protein CusF